MERISSRLNDISIVHKVNGAQEILHQILLCNSLEKISIVLAPGTPFIVVYFVKYCFRSKGHVMKSNLIEIFLAFAIPTANDHELQKVSKMNLYKV